MMTIQELWTYVQAYQVWVVVGACILIYSGFKVYDHFKAKVKDEEHKYPAVKPIKSFEDKIIEITEDNIGRGTPKYFEEELKYIDEQLKSKIIDYERTKNDLIIGREKIYNLKIHIKKLAEDKQVAEQELNRLLTK